MDVSSALGQSATVLAAFDAWIQLLLEIRCLFDDHVIFFLACPGNASFSLRSLSLAALSLVADLEIIV